MIIQETSFDYLTRFGTEPVAYTTLQNGIQHYQKQGVGYTAYDAYKNVHFVLGNPMCSKEDSPEFLDEIVEVLNFPSFVEITADIAQLLRDRHGYYVTPFGVETNFDLKHYSLNGDPKKRNLRSYVRKGQEAANVFELTNTELQDQFHLDAKTEIERISNSWISTKNSQKPLRFLLRDLVYEDEPYVRRFYSIDKNHKMHGFVIFNPMFRDGEVIGYCADLMRSTPDAPKGHVAYIILQALEVFRSEGKEILSLGMSPLASLELSNQFEPNRFLLNTLKLFYNYGNRFYNFKGLAENKRQYRGIEVPVFVATKSKLPIRDVYAFLKLTKVI